jgi:glycosyltransferase involved in cell wall biosynthesis
MKALMTADTVGGVFTYAVELVGALRADGIEVAVATMGAPLSADQRARLDAAGVAAVHESAFRLEWMDDPWEDVDAAGEWLLELEAREHPDVVHVNGYAHAALRWRAPVVAVAHSCVPSWWQAVHACEAPAQWERYRRAVRAGLDAAAVVVAPTAAMLADLERHHGGVGRRGAVVHNGSTAPLVAPDAPRDPLVLAAGRMWDPAKNLAALDAAAHGLAWPVVVAGDLDGRSPLNVRTLGRVPAHELDRLRARAPIFVHPARYEPFGLAPLEGARAGCALVLGDIPSLREVWGDAAAFVDPADARALQAALAQLVDDDAARVRLARRGHDRAQRYTVTAMAQGYRRIYERALARREVAA